MLERTELDELVPERFELLEELGSGSFGVVFRVFDRKRQANAALKTLHYLDPRHLYRFKREFRSLADISHPNLVDLYELVADEELWFFTMSYVDGVDFRTALLDGLPDGDAAERPSVDGAPTRDVERPSLDTPASARDDTARPDDEDEPEPRTADHSLDQDLVRETLRGLVTGVRALHRYGMLHRDLKPGNVLVRSDGRPVVLDFGLVTELDALSDPEPADRDDSGLTGTPSYLAPEAARNVPLDEAADWYSVGVMLYEVLTGSTPFDADTTIGQLYQKTQNSPTPVEEHRPEVDPELARLCMDLLAIDSDARPDGDEILERLGGRDETPGGLRTASQVRQRDGSFVGRSDALETLREVAEKTVATKRPSLVDIHGTSGVGKTALADRFLRNWKDDHPDTAILRGRCHETESVPYKALDGVVDELVPWLQKLPDDELDALLGERAHALAQLFPVLGQLDSVFQPRGVTGVMPESQLRHEAFSGLARLLHRLADERPVIVFIDDVQWGDEDSVRLLEHLLERDQPPAFLLVTTWRDDDVDASSFLERYLALRGQLEETVRHVDLPVEELSPDDARRLARRVVSRATDRDDGIDASAVDVDRIVDESGGNPLFVDELSRYTAESGNLDSSITEFDTVLQERLDELDEHSRQTLDVVAVAGQPVFRDLLRRIVGDDAATPATFSVLRSERLTRVTGAERERLEIYHDRIREALVERLSPEERREIHEQLARALEPTPDSDPETIGFHLEAAGRPEAAADQFVDAADAAADNLAFDRAAQLLERALELGDWSAARAAPLHQRLGDMYASLGLSGRAADAYLEAADHSDGLDTRECRLQAVEQMLRSGDVRHGTDLLYDELEALEFSPVDNRALLLASSLYRRSRLERRGFDFELRRPESLPRRRRLLVEGLTMATLMYGIIDVPRGTYFHYHALPLALETGYPSRVALLLCQQVAQDVALRTAPERGDALLETARELIPECRRDPGRVRSYVTLMEGMRDYFYSRWRSARSAMSRARSIADAEMPGSVWWSAVYEFFECDCLHRMGAFDELHEVVPRALEAARDRDDDFNTVLFRPKRALLALCNDDPDRAKREIDLAESEWTQEGHHLHDFWRERAAVDIDLYRGDLPAAWRRMRREWRNLQRSLLIRSFPLRTFAWGLDGRIAAALAGESSGWRRWRARLRAWRARRKLRNIDTDCSEAFAHLVDGQLALSLENPERADETLKRAQNGFTDADMAFHAHAILLARARLHAGDDGRDLERRAREWMDARGVDSPDEMARIVVPRPPRPDRNPS